MICWALSGEFPCSPAESLIWNQSALRFFRRNSMNNTILKDKTLMITGGTG